MDDPTGAFDLSSFRDKHTELIRRHERLLQGKVYDVTDKLVRTILACAELAMSRPKAERDENFLHAFILLASKVISHTESARLLLNVGRYGDVAVIIRAVSSDAMTIQYLSLCPGEAPDWLKLAGARGVTGTQDRAYRQMLDRFSEGRMRKNIESIGQVPISSRDSFGAYSEAVHAGPWGLQFYAFHELGSGGQFTVRFEPIYQPLVALREATVVGALALQVTEDFLSWCEQQRVDWHREVLERWRPVQMEAIQNLQSCMDAAKSAHQEFFQSDSSNTEP